MDSYAQDWSGEHFKWTVLNLYLDAPSDGEQDSSDEEMGRSPWLFTLPQDEDTIKDHLEDYELDAQHDSHMDNDYSYHRYVSNFDITQWLTASTLHSPWYSARIPCRMLGLHTDSAWNYKN